MKFIGGFNLTNLNGTGIQNYIQPAIIKHVVFGEPYSSDFIGRVARHFNVNGFVVKHHIQIIFNRTRLRFYRLRKSSRIKMFCEKWNYDVNNFCYLILAGHIKNTQAGITSAAEILNLHQHPISVRKLSRGRPKVF